MPLLTKDRYPADIVDQQEKMLQLNGYHIIFDEPSSKADWKRELPCAVQDGLTVCLLLYEVSISSDSNHRFRYCINDPDADPHYIELGDYHENGVHIIGSKVDFQIGTAQRADLMPQIGDYYWLTFAFVSGDNCATYFKGVYLDTRSVTHSWLQRFYHHYAHYQGNVMLSLHIVSTGSPLFTNLSDKPLAFIFVTSRVTVEGSQYTSGGTTQFSVYEYGNEYNKKTIEINPGAALTTIEFLILSYAVIARWEEGSVTTTTDFNGSQEVIIRATSNFSVNKIISYTGMYNGW